MNTPSPHDTLWLPFTQAATAPSPLNIVRGQGATLYDDAGKSYLDLISSWWVTLHGHAHPTIAKTISNQAHTLEHVIFSSCIHEPASQLCQKIKPHLPSDLTRFFFSDNGSTSVEVALKMAYQFWGNQGEKRPAFLAFEGGYHGDTLGAMAVSKGSGFHDPFAPLFCPVSTLPFPATWPDDPDVDTKEKSALTALDHLLEENPDHFAALILEPMIQGAGGMRTCRPSFINKVIERIRAQGILVIFDEVMTGFGRTGPLFALEHTNIVPDFLCLSKGLTGGFLPMALTLTTEQVYKAFLGKTLERAFLHGHSYTGNPLGCAAACASWDLLIHPSCTTQRQMIQEHHQRWSDHARTLPGVHHLRTLGTILAFEVGEKGDEGGYAHLLGPYLKKIFPQKGLLLRPLGNTLYLLPPYCIQPDELERAYTIIEDVLKHLKNKH